MCESRVHGQLCHASAVGGNGALVIQGAEFLQQFAGLGVMRCGRRIQPGERSGVTAAPLRDVQGQGGEVRIQDLRAVVLGPLVVRALAPQAVTHARFETSGAAAALFRGGL